MHIRVKVMQFVEAVRTAATTAAAAAAAATAAAAAAGPILYALVK